MKFQQFFNDNLLFNKRNNICIVSLLNWYLIARGDFNLYLLTVI